MDGDRVTRDDMEQRLDKIDETHRAAFPADKPPPSGVDPSNILAESAKRGRKKPDRLSEQQPDAFVAERDEDEQKGEGMGYHAYMSKHLKQHGGNMAKAAAAYREQKGGHYARKDGSIRGKDKGKYGHTHTPGKNPEVKFEDAQEDEPEPERAPSPPARRITRNMDPREARRRQRGRGASQEDMDEAELEKRLAEIKGSGHDQEGGGFFGHLAHSIEHGAVEGYDWAKTHKAEIAENAALIAAGVFMPGIGEAIDAAALTAEGGEAAAVVTDTTEATEDTAGMFDDAEDDPTNLNPTTTGNASAEADANAATDGVTTDGEGASNRAASKFKPKSTRSLANINSQGRMGALRNLATGADGGATRAQALYNSKFGIGAAALDAGNEILQGDLKGDPAPPTPPPPTPPSNQPDPSEMMRQQERMAAEANAFAANSAALRHNDYYNPF